MYGRKTTTRPRYVVYIAAYNTCYTDDIDAVLMSPYTGYTDAHTAPVQLAINVSVNFPHIVYCSATETAYYI
jgi:hypothetical protein